MNQISKLRLLTTVSGLAAAALFSTAAGAVTNIGSSTTNSTTATGAGSLFLFNTNAGQLNNNGTIGATSGSAITASGTNTGTISNTGTIETASAGSAAVDVNAGSTITNSGTIRNNTANGDAIEISTTGGTTTTTITNSGTITASGTGDAIDGSALVSTEALSVTNSGTITGDVEFGAGADSFTQTAGTTTGNLNLANGANTVTLSGGTLTGNIAGGTGVDTVNLSGATLAGTVDGAGGNDVVNFSGTGTKTLSTAISNVEDINFTAGTTNLNAGAALGSTTSDISAGATVNLNTNVTTTTFTNAGTLVLDGTATSANRVITGAYSQTAAGTLQLAFDDATTATNNATLGVSGAGTFADGATIYVDVADLSTTFTTAAINGDSWTGFDGGAALVGDIADLKILSSNPLIKFTASAGGANDITLTAATATATEIAANVQNSTQAGEITNAELQTAAGGGAGGTNATFVLNGLGGYLSSLSTTNVPSFNIINNAFAGLSSAEAVAVALGDLQADPSIVSSGSQTAVAGIVTVNGIAANNLSEARTQMANAETGASAGNSFGSDLRLWAQPYGSHVDQDKKQGIEGFQADTYGAVIGGDIAVSESVRSGLAVSYGNTNVDGKGTNAANGSDIDSYNITWYGTYVPVQNLFLDGMLGYGWSNTESNRFVAFLGERAKGDYDGNNWNARLGVGYDVHADGLVITPSAFVSHTRVEQDGYTETGSLASVRVNDTDTDASVTGVGLKAAYPIQQSEGLFTPSARVGYSHNFGDKNQSVTQAFANGGGNFTTTGADIDRNAAQFGLAAEYETRGGTVITLDGQYENRSNSDGIAGFARVKAPF